MHTFKDFVSSRASVTLLSSAMLWFVGAFVWFANSESKDGWSMTPIPWMLVLTVTPVSCVVSAIALLCSARRPHFTWLHWIALVAGVVAVAVGGWLVVGVLGSLRGMGIL